MRFKGWKHIFAFNFVQQIKSKAFIGSTILISVIFALLAVGINLLPVLIAGDSDLGGSGVGGEEGEKISALYICNETQFPTFDFAPLAEKSISCSELSAEELDKKGEEIAKGDKSELALKISPVKDNDGKINSISMLMYRPENEDILSKSAAEDFGYVCSDLFKNSVLQSLGVSEKDLPLAQLEYVTDVRIYGAEKMSELKEGLAITIPIIFSALLFSFIISYSQIIAQSVAKEKTSRVIELLITSVRPLAIITGKVLAMLLVAVTQLVIIGAVSGIAFTVTMPFGFLSAGGMETIMNSSQEINPEAANIGAELQEALPGLFNAGSIIAIIVTMLLGFLFYALLAGLVGAGVGRSEDLANALQPFMMVALAGFFLAYMPAVMNYDGTTNMMMTISHYIPISSPFALPGAIVMGDVTGIEIVVSVGLLAVLTALTVLLVSKVYENIILYSGSPLKLGQIIKMAKKSS